MKHYKAIIFDIDGTLWNASEASAEGWNRALERLGFRKRITPEDNEAMAGRPFEECIQAVCQGLPIPFQDLKEELDQAEQEAIGRMGGRFYPAAREIVPALAKHYPIYLISNCQDWYLELFLQQGGFRDSISGYDCNGLSGCGKRTMFQNLLKRESISKAVYIGDTAEDARSARDAGLDFIHASYGFGSVESSERTAQISRLAELKNLFSLPR